MLEATRKIESALVQKLNCMYFVARKVSMPTMESMHKKEKMQEEGQDMYLDFSKQLNELINAYFTISKEGKFIKYSNWRVWFQRIWRYRLLEVRRRGTC